MPDLDDEISNDGPVLTIAGLVALAKGDIENHVVASTPGGIEKQERDGQLETSIVPVLPKGGVWNELKKLGFEIICDYDDLFYQCKFPAGWKKKTTGHSMWTDLHDDKGRKRAGIFYKAAFYDRSAHISLIPRYTATIMPVGGWESDKPFTFHGCVIDNATGENVFETDDKITEGDCDKTQYYKEYDRITLIAKNWLIEHYPNHKNVLEYW